MEGSNRRCLQSTTEIPLSKDPNQLGIYIECFPHDFPLRSSNITAIKNNDKRLTKRTKKGK